jgi:hypothetical protein
MKKLLITIVILTLNLTLFSQTKDKEYYTDIAKAMGYYLGMELTLDLIVEKYPPLSSEAMMAKMNLKIAHEKSMENMASIYEQASGENVDVFKNEIINKILTESDYANFSSYEATAYLHNFEEERIKGNHELYGDFVGIMLSHNSYYQSNPAKEFLDDYKNIFHTDNHSKSKGLNISISYPKSWSSQEGKRPNIITLIQNSNKDCLASLVVGDLLSGMGVTYSSLSNEDIEYLKSAEFANDAINEFEDPKEYLLSAGLKNVTDTDSKRTTIDSQPAIIIKGRGNKSTVLADLDVYMINYIIIYEYYMINIGIMISLNEQDDTQEHINKYDLLTKLIAGSLIIKDQW